MRLKDDGINLLEVDEKFPLGGIHHVTAITSSAQHIYNFFTNILGLRLAKLTVNQDDYETYHLYFTDEDGNAGTDMTFFDFKDIPKGTKGKNNIDRTGMRVPTDASVDYWFDRLTKADVVHGNIQTLFGRKYFDFEDMDGQQYQIVSDQGNTGVAGGKPWMLSNVEKEHAIIGLGPLFVKVGNYENFKLILEAVLGFRHTASEGKYHQFEIATGGSGATIIAVEAEGELEAVQGYGNVHHLALRVKDLDSLQYWIERIQGVRLPNSGFVDRFYFSSEYFLSARNVLFELATDTPGKGALEMVAEGNATITDVEEAKITSGFWIDETKEESGKDLSLPPHLFPGDEATKAATAARLRPLDTSDAMRDRNEDALWTVEDVLKGK
ncbi:MAG: VOC family protein [Streptococcaceae bacterium]|nr:VOC family protein [Streptococcaceae bacterium]